MPGYASENHSKPPVLLAKCDRVSANAKSDRLCYNCSQPVHLACDCPQKAEIEMVMVSTLALGNTSARDVDASVISRTAVIKNFTSMALRCATTAYASIQSADANAPYHLPPPTTDTEAQDQMAVGSFTNGSEEKTKTVRPGADHFPRGFQRF